VCVLLLNVMTTNAMYTHRRGIQRCMRVQLVLSWCISRSMGTSCLGEDVDTCKHLIQKRANQDLIQSFEASTSTAQGCKFCCNDGENVVPCLDVDQCAASGPKMGKYAFIFTYTGKPPENFLPHIERVAMQSDGASAFDMILIMTKDDAKLLSEKQRQRMTFFNVQLMEVDWAVPPNMKFTRKDWCGSQDLVRLHALAVDGYDAVAYYDTDIEFQGDVTPVLRCAATGRLLTTNGGMGEALNVGFFAMKPSPSLLQAALAFAREADYSDITGWAESGWAPANGYYVGGECGQGFFHHLFYKQDKRVSKLALKEAGFAKGSLVAQQIDRCTWNYQTSYDCPDFDCSLVRAHHKPNQPLGPHECLKLGQQWKPPA